MLASAGIYSTSRFETDLRHSQSEAISWLFLDFGCILFRLLHEEDETAYHYMVDEKGEVGQISFFAVLFLETRAYLSRNGTSSCVYAAEGAYHCCFHGAGFTLLEV